MLRLTDLKLPLDHGEAALTAAILKRLVAMNAAATTHASAARSC